MGKLKGKVKGTTLIETIVSMMLIVLIMSITIQFLFQLNRTVGSSLKPNAYFLVKQNLNILNADEEYSEFKGINSSVTITRTLTQYENYDDLFVLEVKALDIDGKEIISAKRIIQEFEIMKIENGEK